MVIEFYNMPVVLGLVCDLIISAKPLSHQNSGKYL